MNESFRRISALLIQLIIVFAISITLFSNLVLASLPVSLSDQGTGVRSKATGQLLESGNITIEIWDSLTGGTKIYTETFTNAIQNGSWNVMIGENPSIPLNLEFGQKYYRNYIINGEDVSFKDMSGQVVDRQYFYAPLGSIRTEDISDGTITDDDISDDTNLTLAQKITFALGETISNIVDGYITVGGNLNITQNLTVAQNASIQGSSLTVGGTQVCLADGTNCQISSTPLWEQTGLVLKPSDSNVETILINKSNENHLIGLKVINENDAGNYAGSTIELKGSGPDYTNNLYFGKYGNSFWVPSWAGNGVLATDKDLVIGAVGTNSNLMIQVGGGYTSPNTISTINSTDWYMNLRRFKLNGSINVTSGNDICIEGGNCLSNFSFSSADNGLSVTNGKVGLGGTLTKNTFIYTDSNNFYLRGDGVKTITDQSISNYIAVYDSSVQLYTDNFKIDLDNGAVVIDDDAHHKGLVYSEDYSTNYDNRSLVDKEYVDNALNAINVTSSNDSNLTFGLIIGYTTNNYDGNITSGTDIGYVAANNICNQEFSGSHFCLKSEVLKTIANGNYTFSGTAWFQNGPPGYTASADDCSGWTTNDNTYLGPFWNWDANAQAGRAALTNCAQQKPLMCCGSQ